MKFRLYILCMMCLQSCTTMNVDSQRYGFFPTPGMSEDAQDRTNTKYNLMDSPDGSQDPTANVKVWGATY